MSRFTSMLMLIGLFAAFGCEQKSADWTPGKVASKTVRHEAVTVVKPTTEHPQQKEEPQKKFVPKPADPTSDAVTLDDVRRDAGQAATTATEFSKRMKKEYQEKLEAKINEMDVKITELREKGRGLKDSAKENWDQMMAELDVKLNAVRTKLDAVVHTSAETWKDVQKDADKTWNDLNDAFNEAVKEH